MTIRNLDEYTTALGTIERFKKSLSEVQERAAAGVEDEYESLRIASAYELQIVSLTRQCEEWERNRLDTSKSFSARIGEEPMIKSLG